MFQSNTDHLKLATSAIKSQWKNYEQIHVLKSTDVEIEKQFTNIPSLNIKTCLLQMTNTWHDPSSANLQIEEILLILIYLLLYSTSAEGL